MKRQFNIPRKDMKVAVWRWSIIMAFSLPVAWGAVENKADAEQWQRKGYTLFMRAEFKQAGKAFQKGLMLSPDSADLHYWSGKCYARQIDLSTFAAVKNARKARRSLEQAVMLDPHDEGYARELFDLYLDFPEFFDHSLDRAADLIESVKSVESRRGMVMRLRMSQHSETGLEYRVRTLTSWTAGEIGYLVPLP
jgi:tetratricopeptide (TPR) repeat protein